MAKLPGPKQFLMLLAMEMGWATLLLLVERWQCLNCWVHLCNLPTNIRLQ